VIVLVNDERDRRLQPATFERLLGLPAETLTPGPHSNTSLSMERIELCRQVNAAVAKRGWTGARSLNAPRRAMLAGLRAAPLRDFESMIPPLPAWTGERLVELSDERAHTVADSGVCVIGDPDLLRYVPDPEAPDLAAPPAVVPTEAAARAVEHTLAGVLKRDRARARRADRRAGRRPAPPGAELAVVPARVLVRELGRRVRGRLPGGAR
jgi:hypothetical protein